MSTDMIRTDMTDRCGCGINTVFRLHKESAVVLNVQ